MNINSENSFPKYISFTITNACNLRCKMCGQWSENGYMHSGRNNLKQQMKLEDWQRLIDELTENGRNSILLRGGEPFLFPKIVELLEYAVKKDVFVSIDTNGTLLDKYADKLTELQKIHLTISVDGPSHVHDMVRGIKGTFEKIKKNLIILNQLEKEKKVDISKSITFTISDNNYNHLSKLPEAARELGLKRIAIIPFLYMTDNDGKKYSRELKEEFGCRAFSWKGFYHKNSGVQFEKFRTEYDSYLENLKEIESFHYLPLSLGEYKTWFEDSTVLIGDVMCGNIEKLIDIQPTGNANFCVDTPDYSFGNAKKQSIYEMWNSEEAERFRSYRRLKPLAACYRCVSRYMSNLVD